LNRSTRRIGFWACAEIDCEKTNATAATIIRKSLGAIPIRTEVPLARAPHRGTWSSVGADTETPNEASKLKPPPQFYSWHYPTKSLEYLIVDGKDYTTRKSSARYKVAMKSHPVKEWSSE
jgi:hypothetical protein